MDLLLKGIGASSSECSTGVGEDVGAAMGSSVDLLTHRASLLLGPNQVQVLGNTPTNKPETPLI